MPKLPLLALGLLVFAGLLAASPALAGEAPSPAPSAAPALCLANTSTAPAVGAPAPLPALIIFQCGVCSEPLCHNKRAGQACGAGPAFQGFRCNNASVCSDDGLYTCTCELA